MDQGQLKRALLQADYGQPSANAPSIVDSLADDCVQQAVNYIWLQLPEYCEKVDSVTLAAGTETYSLASDFFVLVKLTHGDSLYVIKSNADYEANKRLSSSSQGNFCTVRMISGTPTLYVTQPDAGTAYYVYRATHPTLGSAGSTPLFPDIFHNAALLEARRRFQQSGFMSTAVSQQQINEQTVAAELYRAKEMAGYITQDYAIQQDDIIWPTEIPP